MRQISKLRFDSLAGYSRSPSMAFVAKELAWFEEGDEKLLGLIVLDLSDDDYACYILGRDAKHRFRSVWIDHSIPTAEEAYARLEKQLAEYAKSPPEALFQGDEVGKPMDFFKPVVAEGQMHPTFAILTSGIGYSPARGLIAEMMSYFQDVDGNFVREFQTGGFDARLWELYLFALFTELGYGFERHHSAPDFHCVGPLGEFFVEATTLNPGAIMHSDLDDSEKQAYFDNYVPMRFAEAPD